MGCLARSVSAVLSVLLAALLGSREAAAVPVTLAPALETAYGDGFLGTEVLLGRYQQVYSAALFGSNDVLSITGIQLRPFSSLPFSATASALEIVLSTTAAPVTGLSSTFADNLGADQTVVFSGPVPLASGGRTGDPGADFDIVLPLGLSFSYDPSMGNLLLQLRASGSLTDAMGAIQFDTWHTNGAAEVSSLLAFDSNSASGNVFPIGMATRFDVEGLAVPEPGRGLLFAAGLVFLMSPARGRLVSARLLRARPASDQLPLSCQRNRDSNDG